MDLTISFACEFVLLESSFSSLNLFYDLNPMDGGLCDSIET